MLFQIFILPTHIFLRPCFVFLCGFRWVDLLRRNILLAHSKARTILYRIHIKKIIVRGGPKKVTDFLRYVPPLKIFKKKSRKKIFFLKFFFWGWFFKIFFSHLCALSLRSFSCIESQISLRNDCLKLCCELFYPQTSNVCNFFWPPPNQYFF